MTIIAFVALLMRLTLICFLDVLSLLAYCPNGMSLMFRFSLQCPTLSCRHVLFGFSPTELRAVPRVFINLLCLVQYFVWHARNDFRFRDVRPGALPIIANTKVRAKIHLVLFITRFKSSWRQRYFHRQWGACGVVGSAEDGAFPCLVNWSPSA